MTTIALAPAPSAPMPLTRRVWNAVRLHVANPWPTLITPWFIFFAIFAINLAIWGVVISAAGGRDQLDPDAFSYSGGGTWILFFLMVVAIQAMSLTFRFALGLGMTRRDYYLGTSLFIVLLGMSFTTGMAVLAQIERVTDGWGMGGYFFAAGPLREWSFAELWWVLTGAALLMSFVGVVAATMWVRWKAIGLYAFFVALAVVLIGGSWLMTVSDLWAPLGTYLGSHSPAVSVTWTLPVTAVFAVIGYLLLRRATPRA